MPRQRKVPLTLAEHEAIGETLYRIRTTLSAMIVWMGNTYRHEHVRALITVERAINRLRSQLDDAVHREFPAGEHPANAQVYYPGHVKPYDPSHIVWDVPTACTYLSQWADEVRAIVRRLWQAYPVAMGDSVLRYADQLSLEAIDLPYRLVTPKRRALGVG